MRPFQLGLVVMFAVGVTVLVTRAPDARSSGGTCDADGDNHQSGTCGGDDCDDADAERYPGANERCTGTLPSGKAAAGHDEDCNATTVHNELIDGDGDADGDGFVSAACTNPWITSSVPVGYDRHEVRTVTKAKLTTGVDCDDASYVVVPGAQICSGDASVLVCAPSLGFGAMPTSSALAKASGAKTAPAAPAIDAVTNYATVSCPTGTTCRAQPDGTGDCR